MNNIERFIRINELELLVKEAQDSVPGLALDTLQADLRNKGDDLGKELKAQGVTAEQMGEEVEKFIAARLAELEEQ